MLQYARLSSWLLLLLSLVIAVFMSHRPLLHVVRLSHFFHFHPCFEWLCPCLLVVCSEIDCLFVSVLVFPNSLRAIRWGRRDQYINTCFLSACLDYSCYCCSHFPSSLFPCGSIVSFLLYLVPCFEWLRSCLLCSEFVSMFVFCRLKLYKTVNAWT